MYLSTKAAGPSDHILATERETVLLLIARKIKFYFHSNNLVQLISKENRKKKERTRSERILATSADVWLFLFPPQISFVFLNI